MAEDLPSPTADDPEVPAGGDGDRHNSASKGRSSRRINRTAVAGATIVGFIAGSFGLATAGALPDTAQDAARSVLSTVGVSVPSSQSEDEEVDDADEADVDDIEEGDQGDNDQGEVEDSDKADVDDIEEGDVNDVNDGDQGEVEDGDAAEVEDADEADADEVEDEADDADEANDADEVEAGSAGTTP